MKKQTILKIIIAGASGFFVSCTAKVYVNDRHTILEEEAAGEWPEFDKRAISQSLQSAPTAFRKVETNQKKRRLYQILNGEMVETSAMSKK
jgi:hypothetical protein